MKFVCDQCKTKYSIDDARVRGRVLKIRCKQCSFVITVREETAARPSGPISTVPPPAGGSALDHALEDSFGPSSAGGGEHTVVSGPIDLGLIAAAAANSADRGKQEWFVSFDGEQEGPLSLDKVLQRIRLETSRGKEAHAWQEGFDSWLPVGQVPELAKQLKPAAPPARPGGPPPMPAAAAPASRIATPIVRAARPQPAAAVAPLRGGAATRSAPAMAKASDATMHEMGAPSLAMGGSPRNSPAVAIAAARAPAVDATPAPLPAPPIPQPSPVAATRPSSLPAAAVVEVKPEVASPVAASRFADLPIGEPSIMPQPLPALPIATLPPAPAPVVIIAGPGPSGAHWFKWAALVGSAVIVLLLCAVGYLLFRRPVIPTAPPVVAVAQGRPVDDTPAHAIEPVIAKHNDPPPPVLAAGAKAPRVRSGALAAKGANGKQLSSTQSSLAALYGDQDRAQTRELPTAPRIEREKPQVSEQAIADVVRRNKQSLTLCYERVLKRDQSLKNARVDVEVRVGISGSVTGVKVAEAYSTSEIGTCLTQAIRRWHFPSQDSEYGTSFPLLLQAQ